MSKAELQPEFAASEISETTEDDLNRIKQKALPVSDTPPPKDETSPPPTTTTIKLPTSLKDELDRIKQDDQETFAGVIARLIREKSPNKSDPDTVNLSLPRQVYRMILITLPGNLSEQIRKGVR
jgi:hypothetical protein